MSVAEKVEFLLREERGKEVERNTVTDELRRASVDVLDAYKREVFVAGLWRLDFSCYRVSVRRTTTT